MTVEELIILAQQNDFRKEAKGEVSSLDSSIKV